MTETGRFAGDLLAWYDRHRRDLPWRTTDGTLPDPYHVLLSEFMLQQTQVAAVVPYFHRFLAALPTLADLAAADEQQVLQLWEGLGYYRRARHLHAAAKAIVAQHGGDVPGDVATLLALPGVGRYTAGAIASLAHGIRAPILDGNVQRVLCRLDRIEGDPRQPAVQKRLWDRAEAILPSERAGDFNSAMMELGATVCLPRNPQCLVCPVRSHCAAQKAGVQYRIPPPKQAIATPLVERDIWCLRDPVGRYLVEQRPMTGRWPGLWQFLTADRGTDPSADLAHVERADFAHVERLGDLRHALTHRRYHFQVFHAQLPAGPGVGRTLAEIAALPKPKPHVRVLALLKSHDAAASDAPPERTFRKPPPGGREAE